VTSVAGDAVAAEAVQDLAGLDTPDDDGALDSAYGNEARRRGDAGRAGGLLRLWGQDGGE
jgi:hypothetical protein